MLEVGQVTFGLDTDGEPGPNGDKKNIPNKYYCALVPGYPYIGAFTCVDPPAASPPVSSILDVLVSHDKGLTWHTLAPPVSPPLSPPAHGFVYKVTDTGAVLLTAFSTEHLQVGDILRIDEVQTGGASGITLEIRWR